MKKQNKHNEYETGDFVIDKYKNIYEVYVMGSLGIDLHNIKTGLNSDLTYDMADDLKLERIIKCPTIHDFCVFAGVGGSCSQPSDSRIQLLSIELKCHEKNKPNKEELRKEIKRHLIGIEKALEKL